jgi:16S rRNA (guanine966-N2)-methyltransferase
VLDLFAGTGAMGLEALSRGASHATFVEIDRQAMEVVRRNVDATISDTSHPTELIKGEAGRVVRSLALAERHFDLVIFDPPYDRTESLVREMADTLPTICGPDARVVLEVATRHHGAIESAAVAWDAEVLLDRTYGDTAIAILRMPGRSTLGPSDSLQ